MHRSGRIWKRAISLTAAAIVLNVSVSAAAQEPALGEESQIEGAKVNVDTNVYQVIMPTVSEGTFDFILDPQRLINETDGAMYEGQKFEADSSLFFRRTDGGAAEDYSNKSDAVTITNRSSMPVAVSLNVKVEPESLGGIVMSEDRNFTGDQNPSLYLAVTDGEKEFPIGSEGLNLDIAVDAAMDGAYEYVYHSESNEYTYQLKENLEDSVFGAYSFQLTGAANGNGDWTGLEEASPYVSITWSVTPKENTEPRKDVVWNAQERESSDDNQETTIGIKEKSRILENEGVKDRSRSVRDKESIWNEEADADSEQAADVDEENNGDPEGAGAIDKE